MLEACCVTYLAEFRKHCLQIAGVSSETLSKSNATAAVKPIEVPAVHAPSANRPLADGNGRGQVDANLVARAC